MNYPPALYNKMHVIILWFNKLGLIQLIKNIDNTGYITVIWWWSDAVRVVISLGFILHPDLLYTNQNISEMCSVFIFMWRSMKKFLLVYLLFLHENVQQSRHCVTYFHLKMKTGSIYEISWPSYKTRMMDKMQMSNNYHQKDNIIKLSPSFIIYQQ